MGTRRRYKYKNDLKPLADKNLIPQAGSGGVVGTSLNQWASGWINQLMVTTINYLTPTALALGFKIAGGTASKELTVDETTTISNKASRGFCWFMGGG